MVVLVIDSQNLTKSPVTVIQQLGSVEECTASMFCSCVDFQSHVSFDQPTASELAVTCTPKQAIFGAEIVCENVKLAEVYSRSGYLKTVNSEVLMADQESQANDYSISTLFLNLVIYQPISYIRCRLIKSTHTSPINIFHIHFFTSTPSDRRRLSTLETITQQNFEHLPSLPNTTQFPPINQFFDTLSAANLHISQSLPFSSLPASSIPNASKPVFPLSPFVDRKACPIVENGAEVSSKTSKLTVSTQTGFEYVNGDSVKAPELRSEIEALERRLCARIDEKFEALNETLSKLNDRIGALSADFDSQNSSVGAKSKYETSVSHPNETCEINDDRVEVKFAQQLSLSLMEECKADLLLLGLESDKHLRFAATGDS